ncbi:putative reverse transcriptase domain-containing protein, partial [Tanacetum coccineum]
MSYQTRCRPLYWTMNEKSEQMKTKIGMEMETIIEIEVMFQEVEVEVILTLFVPRVDVDTQESVVVLLVLASNAARLVIFSGIARRTLGQDSARITHVYGDLPLQFDDKICSVNALPLNMCEFDMILGIDSLAVHRASVDCHSRRVIFGDIHAPEFIYQGSLSGKSMS